MSEKVTIPDIERKEVQQVDNAKGIILLDPVLPHEIYISSHLEEELDILLKEIKDKDSLGYLAGKGAILSGFQGTGKTVLVKKLAKDLGARIVVIDKEMEPKQISYSFREARKMAETGNVIVFIDEIDSFGQKEYARFGSGMSKITALMTELDGIDSDFKPNRYYYVLAATNYLENVDDRLLRAGRLEEIINVPLPDVRARREILKIHQQNKSDNPHQYQIPDEVVDFLARKTNGYTPADLRALIKHCCIHTLTRKDKDVSKEDAEKALNNFITSVKKGLEYFIEPKFSLEDVVGRELYKEFLQSVLQRDEAKILCYGPKGTGKTLMPEALASYLDYNFIYARGSELQEGIVGEGTKKIKKLFQRAQMAAPCIVLLDEIKGIITARNTISHKDDETAYLNSLLSRPLPGVYLFVTTNNPLEINETTLSRFPYKLFFELPNEEERGMYFKRILNGEFNGDYKMLARKTENFSFRDLDNISKILNRIEAKVVGKEYSKQELFDYIISKYVPENNDEINWGALRNHIGDTLEIEKFVYSITDKVRK